MHQSKKNMNLMILEEDSLTTTQPNKINYTPSTQQSNLGPYHPYSPIHIIEIGELNQKMNQLQHKNSQIQFAIQQLTSKTNPESIQQDPTNSLPLPFSPQLSQQFINVVELKTRIIIQQANKLIQKLANEFQIKLTQILQQKNIQVQNIEYRYIDLFGKIKNDYQIAQQQIIFEYQQLENVLLRRIQDIEQQFNTKLQKLSQNQLQYRSIIKYLQNKIKQLTQSKQRQPCTRINTQNIITSDYQSSKKLSTEHGKPTKKRVKIFQHQPNQLYFTHSKNEPNNKSYNPENCKIEKYRINNYVTSPTISHSRPPTQPKTQNTDTVSNSYNLFSSPQLSTQTQPQPPKKNPYQELFRQATQKQFFNSVPKIEMERTSNQQKDAYYTEISYEQTNQFQNPNQQHIIEYNKYNLYNFN